MKDTARSGIRLEGYCKKQKESMKDTARSGMML